MKYQIIFFETVGQCHWWCCDTMECGHAEGPEKCLDEPMSLVPSFCPCKDVPTAKKSETQPDKTEWVPVTRKRLNSAVKVVMKGGAKNDNMALC